MERKQNMINALVGYTGFVGSNIYAHGHFDKAFNSKNISEAYGLEPDLLVFSGLRAEKYLANNDPEKDMEQISIAENNIDRIAPKRLVLISTIDVFRDPDKADENTPVETEGLHAYGYNRYALECRIRSKYPDALIIRLPGLFGDNIKKNFIYDLINVIPFMLKQEKMNELSAAEPSLANYYQLQDNGFFRLLPIEAEEKKALKEKFLALGFSALNFTDSRSVFQFYDLSRLWDDIQIALEKGIRLMHPATEPVSAAEVYRFITGKSFENELNGKPAYYDYRTVHSTLFGGSDGYICRRGEVLEAIKKFVEAHTT